MTARTATGMNTIASIQRAAWLLQPWACQGPWAKDERRGAIGHLNQTVAQDQPSVPTSQQARHP
ncbi:MAG TPA: hypothetical protein VGA52_00075 [Anaerolineales bacterium]